MSRIKVPYLGNHKCGFCNEQLSHDSLEVRGLGDSLRFCCLECLEHWIIREDPADLNFPPELYATGEERISETGG